MSALLKRERAILPLTPNEDQRGKEGYAVKVASGKAALLTAATDMPIGVILDGENTDGKSSVAVCDAQSGTARVKLDGTPGTVVLGTYLAVTATGTFKADPGSGNRVVCARALETGSANELIEAAIFKPASLT
jgi:hypothetical protein